MVAALDEEIAIGRFKPDKPFKRSGFTDGRTRLNAAGDLNENYNCPPELAALFHWGATGWSSDQAMKDARTRVDDAGRSARSLRLEEMMENGEARALVDEAIRKEGVEFEVRGWDVELKHEPRIYIELKPIVGDDYPAILRTMKLRATRYGTSPRALVVDCFDAEGASLDDVKWLFGQSGIVVRTMAEIRAASLHTPSRLHTSGIVSH